MMLESPMTSTCAHVTYDSRADALAATREYARTIGGNFATSLCPTCGRFSIIFACKMSPLRLEIIRKCALGFTAAEIGRTLGMTPNAVYITMTRMCDDVAANSRTHLVAMAMFLGIIDISAPPMKGTDTWETSTPRATSTASTTLNQRTTASNSLKKDRASPCSAFNR